MNARLNYWKSIKYKYNLRMILVTEERHLARYYIVVMSALIFGTFKVLEDFNKIEGDFSKGNRA